MTLTQKRQDKHKYFIFFQLMFDVPYRFSGLAFQDFQICAKRSQIDC